MKNVVIKCDGRQGVLFAISAGTAIVGKLVYVLCRWVRKRAIGQQERCASLPAMTHGFEVRCSIQLSCSILIQLSESEKIEQIKQKIN